MSKSWRITLILLLILLVVIGMGLGYGLWAVRQIPVFFQESSVIPVEDARQAGRQMLENASALVGNAQRPGDWSALFTEEQLNGWLAADLPENYPDMLPVGCSQPRLKLEEDRVQVGCIYDHPKFSKIVVWLEAEIFVSDTNLVGIRLLKTRAGVFPLPLNQLLEQMSDISRSSDWELTWTREEGDPVALIRLPNWSKKPGEKIMIDTIQLRDGEVYISGRTGVAQQDLKKKE